VATLYALGVDTVLNLLWAAICVVALSLLALTELRLRHGAPGFWRRGMAVLVVTLALFPSVSASDDEVSFWFLTSHNSRGGMGVPVEEKEKATLARLIDVIETYQVQGIWALLIALLLVAQVRWIPKAARQRLFTARSGRAPPLSLHPRANLV